MARLRKDLLLNLVHVIEEHYERLLTHINQDINITKKMNTMSP